MFIYVPELISTVERLLLQRVVAKRVDRKDEIGQQRMRRSQIDLVENRRIDVVVDVRRRPERAVERHPDRLRRIRLDHERRPRREHRILD